MKTVCCLILSFKLDGKCAIRENKSTESPILHPYPLPMCKFVCIRKTAPKLRTTVDIGTIENPFCAECLCDRFAVKCK